MDKEQIISLCSISKDGGLEVHSLVPEEHYDWIEHNEAFIRSEISKRYTTAGFLTRLPEIVKLQLKKATTLCADIETTGFTPYCQPVKITKQTDIGGVTFTKYYAENPGITIADTSLRMRVLALHDPATKMNFVFDLDKLPQHDRQSLIDIVLDGKILIGHNFIAFDYYWLRHESNKKPRAILDTQILVNQCKPAILSYANFDAAKGDKTRLEDIMEAPDVCMIGKASLEAISIALSLPRPDKTFQKPQNWCLSELSERHLNYVLGDISAPVRIVEHIFGNCDGEAVIEIIKRKYPWYVAFHKAARRMTDAMVRGISVDMGKADALKIELAADIRAAAEVFFQQSEGQLIWSEFSEDPETKSDLENPSKGVTNRIKSAIEKNAARTLVPVIDANGETVMEPVKLPLTNEGNISLSKKSVKFHRINLPALDALITLGEVKKLYALIDDWQEFARPDANGIHRIHPLFGFTLATGRASTSNPNPLGAPRDKRIRSLIGGLPGRKALISDYEAIELRIAVANAERAIEDTRKLLVTCHSIYDVPEGRNGSQKWFLKECFRGKQADISGTPHPMPTEEPMSGYTDEDWKIQKHSFLISHYAGLVLNRETQSLASIFLKGVDPHLATGLTMLRERGVTEFDGIPCNEGSISDWLAARTKEELSRIKKSYADARQMAKAVNFGLLYGMGADSLHEYGIVNYGVEWTLEEATLARDMWFRLYPEVAFYHLFIKYMRSDKYTAEDVVVWDKYTRAARTREYGSRVYTPTTLTRRPFYVLDAYTNALNYPGQGSGADMIARAIANLPEEMAECLTLAIHDELFLVVPEELADTHLEKLETAMNEAGDYVLSDYCRSAVDAKIATCWTK
jgi:hypothetical protein